MIGPPSPPDAHQDARDDADDDLERDERRRGTCSAKDKFPAGFRPRPRSINRSKVHNAGAGRSQHRRVEESH
jgi:hypothetical protein